MTIKKSWTVKIPFLGERQRSKVLKPGHIELVVIDGWDTEMKSRTYAQRHLEVFPDGVFLKEVGRKHRLTVYIEDEVNTKMLAKEWDERLREPRSFFEEPGREIQITYEPTLPQSRK